MGSVRAGPRHVDRAPGPAVPRGALRVLTGVGQGAAWDLVDDLDPGGLPPEGYVLRVGSAPTGPFAAVVGADARGVRYGLRTLAELPEDPPSHIRPVSVRDWPALAWRGTIEGFYGPPWTHGDRLAHLAFAARHRLNLYVYAPKDDPHHRRRWRDPYPEADLAPITELVRAAEAAGVRFVYAISPGLSMRYSDDGEQDRLQARARQLATVGVREFALLFDDIPTELEHPEDVRVFGSGPGAAGAAHGRTSALFAAAVLGPSGPPLVVCPTDYAGTASSPYRERLAETLPEDALVWWTGSDIVVGAVTRADIDAATASYRRPLLLWDNFPVNDFDRTRLFLGPLTGRTADPGAALRGITANPMIQAGPSQLALATVAEWAWNPGAYRPAEAAARALADVAGPLAPALAPLVRTCSGWPPGDPTDAALWRQAREALDGRPGAAASLRTALDMLRGVPAAVAAVLAAGGHAPELHRLAEEVLPWAVAGRAMAEAGLAALDLLDAGTADPACRRRVSAALDRAEQHYPAVLRDVVPPLARGALAATEPPGTAVPGTGVPVLLVTGPEETRGDATVADGLRVLGADVRTTGGRDPRAALDGEDLALVVVGRSASAQHARSAATLAAPLVAYAHLVELGLATGSGSLMAQECVRATPEGRAAGLPAGPVRVYRGPGTLTWGLPGPDAVVLARTGESGSALFHYPPGARLADGTVTAHHRGAVFLGREGLAPWLITGRGRRLVAAAFSAALSAPRAGGAEPQRAST